MGIRFDRSWPITVKVPVAVASLMLLVGFVLSERVLSRLGDTQERHLVELSQSYLDGLSSAIIPSILREDNWEIFDAITRMQAINKSLHPTETIEWLFLGFRRARCMLTGEPFNPTFFSTAGIASEPSRAAHRCSKRL
jgi:hypothetical protein